MITLQNRQKIILLVLGVVALLALLIFTVTSRTKRIRTASIPATQTTYLADRILGYTLLPNAHIIIYNSIANQFQELDINKHVIQSWPGDYYVNPAFLWSPDRKKVVVVQQPANPPPILLTIYDFGRSRVTRLPENIIAVSWKNDRELYAQTSNPQRPGANFVLLDLEGNIKNTLYVHTQTIGPVTIYQTSLADVLAIYDNSNNQLYSLNATKKELKKLYSSPITPPSFNPTGQFAIFSEINSGNTMPTILYQLATNTKASLPSAVIPDTILWIDADKFIGSTAKGALLGEKLILYSLKNKAILSTIESNKNLPLRLRNLQFDAVNKLLYFVDGDFLYRIPADL